jgi:hypothetical protein
MATPISARVTAVRRGARSIAARLRGGLGGLALAAASLLLLAAAGEALLRAFPSWIPSGIYGAGRFDPALGMNVRASDVIYHRFGTLVRKRPNPDGFLDVAHAVARPPGVARIGFFGDSYVEANQVPTADTFFRRLPALMPRPVETFGFGLSGWGTLQALRAFEVEAPRYDLDLAVYVFCENDPGDNSLELSEHRHDAEMPYATLSEGRPGYRVREAEAPAATPAREVAKWLQRHSLLAEVVWVRLRLLQREGFRLEPPSDDAAPSSRVVKAARPAKPGRKPNPNDDPFTWPEGERANTLLLAERILADWKRRADEAGVPLVVLYVPRGNRMLLGLLGEEDTWLPWLREVCARLGIPLVDPRQALIARLDAGDEVFLDHWTEAGHETIARLLAEALPQYLPPAP